MTTANPKQSSWGAIPLSDKILGSVCIAAAMFSFVYSGIQLNDIQNKIEHINVIKSPALQNQAKDQLNLRAIVNSWKNNANSQSNTLVCAEAVANATNKIADILTTASHFESGTDNIDTQTRREQANMMIACYGGRFQAMDNLKASLVLDLEVVYGHDATPLSNKEVKEIIQIINADEANTQLIQFNKEFEASIANNSPTSTLP